MPVTTTAPSPAPGAVRAAFATVPSGRYTVIVALFCGLLLISNVAATKAITVVDGLPGWLGGGIYTDGGALLFPLTYILGDVLSEVYGLRQARRAIWVGFGLAALASVTFLVVGAAPPGPGYENQAAFVAVLGFVPRIVIASLCGYLAGQFLNAYVLVKIKERFGERRMWVRLVSSTVVGEFADTALFCFLAFAGSGIFPTWGSLISYTVVGYLYKVAVEVIFLPVTYAVIKSIKKREPGYGSAPTAATRGVRQLRLVVAVDDYDRAVRFYRDELGLRRSRALFRRRRGRGDDPGRRPGDPGAVQSGPDRADRSLRGRPHRGQPALPGGLRGRRLRRGHRAAERGRRRRHRRADPDALELPQRPPDRPRRHPADLLHRTGRTPPSRGSWISPTLRRAQGAFSVSAGGRPPPEDVP